MDKRRLGAASYPAKLEKIRCNFAIIPDYDYLSYRVVGGNLHRNCMDAGEGFGPAIRHVYGRLRVYGHRHRTTASSDLIKSVSVPKIWFSGNLAAESH